MQVQLDAHAGDISLPLRLVEPLGKDTLLYFNDATERAFIAVSEGLALAGLKPGARCGLTLAADKMFLFAPDGRRIHDGDRTAVVTRGPIGLAI